MWSNNTQTKYSRFVSISFIMVVYKMIDSQPIENKTGNHYRWYG